MNSAEAVIFVWVIGYQSIEFVRVRCGSTLGILPESFPFHLDAAKKGIIAQEAQWIVDFVPLGGACNEYGSHFEMEEAYILACPLCASRSFAINNGYRLAILNRG